MSVDTFRHNRDAWNRRVELGDPWTVPVTSDQVRAARAGDWSIVLTPLIPVPRDWFGEIEGAQVLCLASGGGQQAPILAAAGAHVTLLDASPAQLDRDRAVAERDGLEIRLERGDMADLSRFDDGVFDLVFHPVSNCFMPDVRTLWREAARVTRTGGHLLAGFCNPLLFLFDEEADDADALRVRYPVPYADTEHLPPERVAALVERREPLTYGHTLDDQIGAQIEAGFDLVGFYEDRDPDSPLREWISSFIATRARRR